MPDGSKPYGMYHYDHPDHPINERVIRKWWDIKNRIKFLVYFLPFLYTGQPRITGKQKGGRE